MRRTLLATIATALVLLAGSAGAADRRTPLRLVRALPPAILELEFDAPAAATLRGLESVALLDFPLPDGATVSLELRRQHLTGTAAVRSVDGVRGSFASGDERVTTWSGRVAGEHDSFAFLAFSDAGTRGFVRRGHETIHVAPLRSAAGALASGRVAVFGAEALPDAVLPPFCDMPDAAAPVPLPALAALAPPPGAAALTALGGPADAPHYLCRLAVETDFQFFSLFGNLVQAEVYATTLLGAVSALYEDEIGVRLEVAYLGLHSQASDGWVAQETSGAGTSTLLNEFRAAWDGGAAPVDADLYHFLSGANLGGGIAYLDAICDQWYGFGVSASMNGDLTFPVASGWNTWDFVVVAHELGHNLGSPHTHAFCPPLDQCAPSGYFGSCQTQQSCQSGTILSYCHLCAGGMNNIAMQNHPAVQAYLRETTSASCLEFVGVPLLATDAPATVEVESAAGAGSTTHAIAVSKADPSGMPAQYTAALLAPTAWLEVSPSAGVLETPGAAEDVVLTFDPLAAAPGEQTATVRIANADDPDQHTDVLVRFTVLGTALELGGAATGSLEAPGDSDLASFYALKGMKARFTFTPAADTVDAAVRVTDAKGKLAAKWKVAGAPVVKDVKFKRTGWHTLSIAGLGDASGAYQIDTEVLAWPASSVSRGAAAKTKAATKKVEFKILALPGTELDLGLTLAPPPTATPEYSLQSDAGDTGATFTGPTNSGAALAAFVLDQGGAYKVRIAALEQANVAIAASIGLVPPAPPGAPVDLDG